MGPAPKRAPGPGPRQLSMQQETSGDDVSAEVQAANCSVAVVLLNGSSAGGIGINFRYRSATAAWYYPHSVLGLSSDCGRRHLSIQ